MLHNRASHLKHLSNLNAAFYFKSRNEVNNLLSKYTPFSAKHTVKSPLPIQKQNEVDSSASTVKITVSDSEDEGNEFNKSDLEEIDEKIFDNSCPNPLKKKQENFTSSENSMLMKAPVKKLKVQHEGEVIGIPQKMAPLKNKNSPGGFEKGDKVEKILGGKFLKNKEIVFSVEWKTRENGVKPEKSRVTSKELREYDADFLLDFYESRFATYSKRDGDEAKLVELLENLKIKEKEKELGVREIQKMMIDE